MKKSIVIILIICMLLLTSCTVTISTDVKETEIKDLKVHFIDVGQADCILIELPTNEEVLIDAGNRGDADVIIDYLNKLNIDDIEYFILTHPHEDHIGSAPKVFENFDVGKVYMPNVSYDSAIYKETIEAIERENAQLYKAKAGTNIFSSDKISFNILGPNSMWYSELNEYSLVTRLVYGDTSFIFTGDAESVSELEIINSGVNIKSDLLKVGHHGGETSSSKIFLENVSPEFAVISVGKDNPYGHPHKRTLNRLNTVGATIYRTDELGSIIATSNGSQIIIDKQTTNTEIEKTPVSKVKYIGNSNSLIFHYPDCSSTSTMKDSNKVFFNNRTDATKQGYEPCGICNP